MLFVAAVLWFTVVFGVAAAAEFSGLDEVDGEEEWGC
jgi:hypothetical protein